MHTNFGFWLALGLAACSSDKENEQKEEISESTDSAEESVGEPGNEPSSDPTDEPWSGVEPTEELPAGVNELFFTQLIDGVEESRKVIMHAPETLDLSRDYPVLIYLHGSGGNAESGLPRLSDLVDSGEFIGIYPQGHEQKWNIGQNGLVSDEYEFFDLIFSELYTHKNLDFSRVYALGFSNGAGMAQMLAVKTDYLRGIAAMSTALVEGEVPTSETGKISVLQVHGDEDQLCPYDGGGGPGGLVFLSSEDSASTWAAHNNCPEPLEESTAEGNIRFSWSPCDSGTEVLQYRMVGIGHGMPPMAEGGLIPLAWNFLSAQQ